MKRREFDPTGSRLAEVYPGTFVELLEEHGEDWGLYELMRQARLRS